uniref:hypothetical protein n=1 Tax=Daedaleopsis nitida TaxID=1140402 RepID=UPI0030DE7B90
MDNQQEPNCISNARKGSSEAIHDHFFFLTKEIWYSPAITERLWFVLKLLFILLFILYQIFNYNSQCLILNFVSFFSILQFNVVPIKPLITYNDLSNINFLRKELKNKAGVYGIINTKSSKQYIGSSLNLYSRLMDHIKGRDSNLILQRSIRKDGLKNFKIVVYSFHNLPAVLLTDIETTVISAFPFSSLYHLGK